MRLTDASIDNPDLFAFKNITAVRQYLYNIQRRVAREASLCYWAMGNVSYSHYKGVQYSEVRNSLLFNTFRNFK